VSDTYNLYFIWEIIQFSYINNWYWWNYAYSTRFCTKRKNLAGKNITLSRKVSI